MSAEGCVSLLLVVALLEPGKSLERFSRNMENSNSERILSGPALLSDPLGFIVINRGGCSFNLSVCACTSDLKRSIADSCDVSVPFEVQLLGKTILHSRTPIHDNIAEMPYIVSTANDLYHIWGDGFRIPITVQPTNITKQNMSIFDLLSELFGGTESNVHEFEWHRFILQCAESKACTIQDLCDHFQGHFRCNNGELVTINFHQKLTGHIDLHFLPNTVTNLLLDRNSFSDIFGLDQLAGKVMRHLDIRGSVLELDLEPLTKTSPRSVGNPLRSIRVSTHQISRSLLGNQLRKRPENYYLTSEEIGITVRRVTTLWFRSSILKSMMLGRTRLKKTKDDQVISSIDDHCDKMYQQFFQGRVAKSV